MDNRQKPFRQKDHLDYPSLTMFQMVERMAEEFPDAPARRRGDRRDGRMVKAPGLRTVMAYLMPKRTDCEVYLHDTIDCTELLKYIEEKNASHPEYTTTVFHCIITALARDVKEIRTLIDIGATLDERIADGFYFARSLKLLHHIFANPDMPDKAVGEASGFTYE